MDSLLKEIKDPAYLVDAKSRIPVPLRSIDIQADIEQNLAAFTMTQNYVNFSESPIETVFFFPTDVHSVMTKMEIDFTLEDGSK